MPQRTDQHGAENRAGKPSYTGPAGDQGEGALGLGSHQYVGQHAPSQRYGDQIKNRQPNIKRPC